MTQPFLRDIILNNNLYVCMCNVYSNGEKMEFLKVCGPRPKTFSYVK